MTVEGCDDFKHVHVARLRYDADEALQVTADFKEVFQHTFTRGNFEIAGIVDISKAEKGDGLDAMVEWVGVEEQENSWESLKGIWDDAPELGISEMRIALTL